ncbi:MAG: hypothetical protein D6811_05775 [Alphaproteobacteria bacterium]|nr:MAG: hypothetical protein D6811_05775 [Alphaproteobacteria bacterium]
MKGLVSEAVLLCRRTPAPEFSVFQERLNAALADLGVEFSAPSAAGHNAQVLATPAMALHLSITAVPLPGRPLAEPLEVALERPTAAALQAAVTSHRATLTLSLETRPGARQLAPELKTMVLGRAVQVACALCAAEAALWLPTQMLFTAAEIAAFDPRRFPVRLAFRPEPIEPDSIGGLAGLRARHSELFCGHQLVIPPGRMEYGAAVRAMEVALERHVTRAGAIAEGVAIPVSPDTQLAVSLCQDTTHCPTGCFCLEPEPLGTARPATVAPVATAAAPAPRPRRSALARPAGRGSVSRSHALRTWALCAALATITPLGAAALFLWNLLRGPNLAVSAVTFALLLAVFTGLWTVQFAAPDNGRLAALALQAMARPF